MIFPVAAVDISMVSVPRSLRCLLTALILMGFAQVGQGQPLEEIANSPLYPHWGPARSHLARVVVAKIPDLVPTPDAIRMAPDRESRIGGYARDLARQLRSLGFHVLETDESTLVGRVVSLRMITHRDDQGVHQMRIHMAGDPPIDATVRFGNATWVNNPEPGAMICEGPLTPDREKAVHATKQLIRQRLETLHGDHVSMCIDHLNSDWFMEEKAVGSRTYYRCHVRLNDFEPTGATFVRTCLEESRNRSPGPLRGKGRSLRWWGTLGFAIFFGLSYLRADLATKGWHSRGLSLLFATLFLVSMGLLWKVTL